MLCCVGDFLGGPLLPPPLSTPPMAGMILANQLCLPLACGLPSCCAASAASALVPAWLPCMVISDDPPDPALMLVGCTRIWSVPALPAVRACMLVALPLAPGPASPPVDAADAAVAAWESTALPWVLLLLALPAALRAPASSGPCSAEVAAARVVWKWVLSCMCVCACVHVRIEGLEVRRGQ